jgi:hypothetical protein
MRRSRSGYNRSIPAYEVKGSIESDAVIFRRLPKNTNWLTILKGCPVKMDDLPPRRREFPKRLKL